MSDSLVLRLENISKTFVKGKLRKEVLKDVSLEINSGEILGLIGESGSGKSTIANIVTGFETPDSGSIFFQGKKTEYGKKQLKSNMKRSYTDIQMVFQNPESSFAPGFKVMESVIEGIRYIKKGEDHRKKASELLSLVGIDEELYEKKCRDLSGGQCQRVAIARALISEPRLIIHDEITSALDVQSQARVLNLLYDLKMNKNMGMLFISHDIAVVSSICERVAVLKDGRVVETGYTDKIINSPGNEYTRQLIDAVQTI